MLAGPSAPGVANTIGSQRDNDDVEGSVRRTKAGQEMVEGEEESVSAVTGPRICETGNQSQVSPTDAPRGAPCPCAVVTPGRRALLAAGVGIGVDLAARVAGAQSDAAHARPKEGDLLVKVGDTTPLGPDSLSIGEGQVMAWPMDPAEKVVRDGSRLNKVLLVKLDPATLDQQTKERAANSWPTRQSVPTPDVRWSIGPPSARFSSVRATTLNTIPRQGRASSRPVAAQSRGAAAGRYEWKADGRPAIHRATGYSTDVTCNSTNRDGCDQGYPAAETKRGTNVRQTKCVA